MSTKKKAQPAKPYIQAKHNGVVAELSDEAIHNLTGYFDVLIQMDLEQQRNERSKDDEIGIQASTSGAA